MLSHQLGRRRALARRRRASRLGKRARGGGRRPRQLARRARAPRRPRARRARRPPVRPRVGAVDRRVHVAERAVVGSCAALRASVRRVCGAGDATPQPAASRSQAQPTPSPEAPSPHAPSTWHTAPSTWRSSSSTCLRPARRPSHSCSEWSASCASLSARPCWSSSTSSTPRGHAPTARDVPPTMHGVYMHHIILTGGRVRRRFVWPGPAEAGMLALNAALGTVLANVLLARAMQVRAFFDVARSEPTRARRLGPMPRPHAV